MADSSSRPHFADHQCAGQAYLDLYQRDPKPERIAAISKEIEATRASGTTSYWTWVDALHMAMPVFARFGVAHRDESLLASMHQLYLWTRNSESGGLFDPGTGLWWRDGKYVHTPTLWSRGNGWAVAALAKVLGALPANDPRRPRYVADLRASAARLRAVQRSDGFWNVDLGDAGDYPGPETSGTALFTFGLGWAVNHGVLDAAGYAPVVRRAWQGLVGTALHPDGRLGYVQGAGQRPSDHQPVTSGDTADFGVGAFLLAAGEVAALRR